MGHHAQYRKRGSTPTGGSTVLAAPDPSDWDARWSAGMLQGKSLVLFPPPAQRLKVQARQGAGTWDHEYNIEVDNVWRTVWASPPSGLTELRSAWFNITAELQLSPWSASKTVVVP